MPIFAVAASSEGRTKCENTQMPQHHHHHALQHRGRSVRGRHSGWSDGRSFGKNLPSLSELGKFVVNGITWEGIGNTLYDAQTYAANGHSLLTFFQVPRGSGTATLGSGAKSLSDTNMTLNGNLAANTMFLVESVELDFQVVTPTVAAHMPAVGAVATATPTQVNDAYIFRRAGNLVFTVGSKNYIEEAPLMKFPARSYLAIDGAVSDTTTAGATGATRVALAHAMGPIYKIPPILLEHGQNFSLTLNWPEGVQAITDPGRVFAILGGAYYRRSQ